jgi:amino-acid N-acetyltransferase
VTKANWTLRTVRDTDRDVVAALLSEADLPVLGLQEQFGDGYVVAERDGDIVGVGGMEVYGCYGLLRSVVVKPGFRGEGLGEAIVFNRLKWSARRGLKAVYLLTTTVPGFFGRLGFNVTPRAEMPVEIQGSKEFTEACPATATAMVLRVEPLC